MNTLLVVALLIIALAITARLMMLIRRDRPASPPADQVDWRADGLSWRHLGIN